MLRAAQWEGGKGENAYLHLNLAMQETCSKYLTCFPISAVMNDACWNHGNRGHDDR